MLQNIIISNANCTVFFPLLRIDRNVDSVRSDEQASIHRAIENCKLCKNQYIISITLILMRMDAVILTLLEMDV